MTKTISGQPASLDDAKAQARRLRRKLSATTDISNCQALELIAATHGHQSWGAMKAALAAPSPASDQTSWDVPFLDEVLKIHAGSWTGVIAIEAAAGVGKTTLAMQIAEVARGHVIRCWGQLPTPSVIPLIDWTGTRLVHFDEVEGMDSASRETIIPALIREAKARNIPVLVTAQDLGCVRHLLPASTFVCRLGYPG